MFWAKTIIIYVINKVNKHQNATVKMLEETHFEDSTKATFLVVIAHFSEDENICETDNSHIRCKKYNPENCCVRLSTAVSSFQKWIFSTKICTDLVSLDAYLRQNTIKREW